MTPSQQKKIKSKSKSDAIKQYPQSQEAISSHRIKQKAIDDEKRFSDMVELFLWRFVLTLVLLFAIYSAYKIRLLAVFNYGRVIHEFDPWFNFRATEYLVENGILKFFNWYDESSWYPIGRPIGSTIYPGLQFTAAGIYYLANAVQNPYKGISLNDVCVFVPAIFGVLTTLATWLLAFEVTRDEASAVIAAVFMAVSPAHLMRSVAGGFDNESIAVFAIVFTFYLWCRCLRTNQSWPIALLAALSYIYMVSAWGGYVFVINMIAIHTLLIAIRTIHFENTPSFHLTFQNPTSIYLAYSIVYVVGTIGAMFIPVVGWTPLRSLEQLLPIAVFGLLQLLKLNHWLISGSEKRKTYATLLFFILIAMFIMIATKILFFCWKNGYLGPLTARVRGLFLKHARTGNPLVDSVAEHQHTRTEMYYLYFHAVKDIAPFGFILLFRRINNAQLFMILYAIITYYFSAKMVRLLLLLATPICILGASALVSIVRWCFYQFTGQGNLNPTDSFFMPDNENNNNDEEKEKISQNNETSTSRKPTTSMFMDAELDQELKSFYNDNSLIRQIVSALFLWLVFSNSLSHVRHCMGMAGQLSSPAIMMRSRKSTGEIVIMDDFREAYWWLRDKTPTDSRVLSWWDYGYQINGIANRTTIADGNTWNHEHIALLGKSLVSPMPQGHAIMQHLADYVLVWSTSYGGVFGDDVAKSPHMAKIAASVYKDINASDFYRASPDEPSEMMQASVVYNLVHFRLNETISDRHFRTDRETEETSEHYFREVFTSTNQMVRIYKVLKVSSKSKQYGSEGRGYKAWLSGIKSTELYPPALQQILNQKVDFKQLEDFNVIENRQSPEVVEGECETSILSNDDDIVKDDNANWWNAFEEYKDYEEDEE